MKVLFTGLPGSGKTTQARMLASELGLPLISMGATLRTLSLEENEMGEKIRQSLEKGEFVDDVLVASLMKKRVEQSDCNIGFVMDGYPRSIAQLDHFNPEFDKVFNLTLSDEESKNRLLHRHREDDTPEIIEKRLKIHKQVLGGLIEFFKQNGSLVEIDGSKSVEEVNKAIQKAI